MKEDLTGNRYSRLAVLQFSQKIKNMNYWVCKCDCGKVVSVRQDHLKSGKTKSCGCFKRENAATTNTTHGMTRTRLYNIWGLMKDRCSNQKNNRYKYYGGRGIKVCGEWNYNFMVFYDWAMSHGYADDLSIDRINNDGNYEQGNCRWATDLEQGRNKRPRVSNKSISKETI